MKPTVVHEVQSRGRETSPIGIWTTLLAFLALTTLTSPRVYLGTIDLVLNESKCPFIVSLSRQAWAQNNVIRGLALGTVRAAFCAPLSFPRASTWVWAEVQVLSILLKVYAILRFNTHGYSSLSWYRTKLHPVEWVTHTYVFALTCTRSQTDTLISTPLLTYIHWKCTLPFTVHLLIWLLIDARPHTHAHTHTLTNTDFPTLILFHAQCACSPLCTGFC